MQNCCGCADMRKGVITIGIIGLITSFALLTIQFAALAERQHIMKDPTDNYCNNLFSFIFVMGIAVCFFKFISDILVIFGAINQTTKEISVWLIINLCSILYTFITMVSIYILLVDHESFIQFQSVIWTEAILFTMNVSFVYFWYQVYFFSRQLYLDGRTSLEEIVQNGGSAVNQ